jgi:hypothetical protein
MKELQKKILIALASNVEIFVCHIYVLICSLVATTFQLDLILQYVPMLFIS